MSTITKGQEILDNAKSKYGFVPNLYRNIVDAGAVSVLEIYLNSVAKIGEGSLNQQEIQTLMLAISTYNDCNFCKAAHTMLTKMNKVDSADIEAIKNGNLPANERLANLVAAAKAIYDKKGFLSDEEIADFDAKGVDKQQLFEIVAIVGIKTISNYVNHIAHTEVNAEFLA